MRAFTFIVILPLISAACSPDLDSTGPSRPSGAAAMEFSADFAPLTVLACGDLVTSDIRLDNDLNCAGNAILVTGEGIRIDLNGHTLEGAAAGNGITVTASHGVVIFGGVVKGFVTGIFVGGSTDIVIRDNEFTQNGTAVLFQATSSSTIMNNVAWQNLARAVMIRPNLAGVPSTDNLILNNFVSDTPTGLFLINQPGNTIKHNTISGSGIAAIDLFVGGASDNVVTANVLSGGGAGIRFGTGWTANTFIGNRIAENICAIQGPTTGNTFIGNVLSANAADSCA
jgi:parallel beta-helix repeat protein